MDAYATNLKEAKIGFLTGTRMADEALAKEAGSNDASGTGRGGAFDEKEEDRMRKELVGHLKNVSIIYQKESAKKKVSRHFLVRSCTVGHDRVMAHRTFF